MIVTSVLVLFALSAALGAAGPAAASGRATSGPRAAAEGARGAVQSPLPVRPPRRRLLRPLVQPVGELTVLLPGDVRLELVRIPAGSRFTMGAPVGERGGSRWERPRHAVTIAHDFYLGRYEVTQGQWRAVMGSNPAHAYGVGFTYPVYYVSWDDIAGAGGFIERLNRTLGTAGFRLPSEAEWEYAARAGTTTEFSFQVPSGWDTRCGGLQVADTCMWWCGSDPPGGPFEVGQKEPNPWGLFDMHGNVQEWVQDWFHPDYAGAPSDGSAWEVPPASLRVVRGGGWNLPASYCRSAARLPLEPGHMCFNLGFRVARSVTD